LTLFHKVTKLFQGANKIIEVIGNLCIWGMFAIILANTLLRTIFGYSFPWAEEISKLLMVWMAMLVAALALYEGRHVALTFLFEKIKPKYQVIALLIFDILTLVFSLILADSGDLYVWDNMDAVLPASGLPRCVLYAALPAGGIVMAVYSVYLIWKRILQIKGTVPYELETKEGEAEVE